MIIEILTTPNHINVEMFIAILGSFTALVVAGIGLYSKYMTRAIKKLVAISESTKESLTTLKHHSSLQFDENNKQHIMIFTQMKKHNQVVEDIFKIKSLNEKIEDVIAKSLEYIDSNCAIMTYIENKSLLTKALTESIIDSNFKLTLKEIKARLSHYITEIHSKDKLLGSDILKILKSDRDKLEKEYSKRVIQMVGDSLLNSKYDRLETMTVYFLQQNTVLLVRAILKTKK